MSNHDFGRLATRFGAENARAAAMLLLTLPGTGVRLPGRRDRASGTARPASPPYDRAGRDRYRHPMQWDARPRRRLQRPAEPWLPVLDPAERNVEDQRADPGSTLALVRELIALRRGLGEGFELLDAAPGVIAYRARRRTWWPSTPPPSPPRAAGAGRAARCATAPDAIRGGELAPNAGVDLELIERAGLRGR